jgi:cytochrome c5
VETTDKQFFLTFLAVMGFLVFLTVVVMIAANLIDSSDAKAEMNAAQTKLAQERIQPVGNLNLKSNPQQPVAEAPTVIAAAPSQSSGQQVYSGLCQACHATGAGGAPVVGNAAVWKPRLAQGLETLYRSAIAGKGAMPPKGGNPTLADAEIKAAVDYMLQLSK